MALWLFDDAVVALVAMDEAHDASILQPEEQALVDTARTPKRRSEVLAGRLAARTAFENAGLTRPPAVLRAADGTPQLEPTTEGWFVSIAHDGDWAVAAVSRASVGVDVLPTSRFESAERVVSERLKTNRAKALMPHAPASWPDTALSWTAWEALGKHDGRGVFPAMNLEITIESGPEGLTGRAGNVRLRWWEASGALFCLATNEG